MAVCRREPPSGSSAALVLLPGRAVWRRTLSSDEKEPLSDGISGATPRGGFELKLCPDSGLTRFIVKVEVNHSTDFNDAFSESSREGEAGYSGGKHGSGQPAVVYAAEVDLSSGGSLFEAVLIGYSSPDGSSGEICPDVSGLTTALRIVKRITVCIP